MQGSSGSDRELLDAAGLVGHLVPVGSVYRPRGEVIDKTLQARCRHGHDLGIRLERLLALQISYRRSDQGEVHLPAD